MNVLMRTFNRSFGARMAKSGRFGLSETVGRSTGRRHATPVGYVRTPDGALLVGAGAAGAHWAQNLVANPACRASSRRATRDYAAHVLAGAEREDALRAIKGRYGPGMADRIGAGPVFRLELAAATLPV
ncbi:MAG: nitroreductase family deazaflavin-dependent oxidoreductase [Chloroflexota bacterium]